MGIYMLYNNNDILFWNSISIEHIDLLLESLSEDDLKDILNNYKNAFIYLNEIDNDEDYIYHCIKIHSQFINELASKKSEIKSNNYSINHIINEGIYAYRILLIIEQKAKPIEIIENIRIQEMIIPNSIEHLIKVINIKDKYKVNLKLKKKKKKSNLLKTKQNKYFYYYSKTGNIKKIISLNKTIYKTINKSIKQYNILNTNPTNILSHIIKEEDYYLSLLDRIKKALDI